MHPEPFLIDRFHTQKHVMESQRFPELENVPIAQQDVAPRLQIVLFLNPSSRNRLPDLKSLFRLNEGNVIYEEHPSFLNPLQFFDSFFCADHAVAPSIKSPGAAERTIPGTTSGKFD